LFNRALFVRCRPDSIVGTILIFQHGHAIKFPNFLTQSNALVHYNIMAHTKIDNGKREENMGWRDRKERYGNLVWVCACVCVWVCVGVWMGVRTSILESCMCVNVCAEHARKQLPHTGTGICFPGVGTVLDSSCFYFFTFPTRAWVTWPLSSGHIWNGGQAFQEKRKSTDNDLDHRRWQSAVDDI